MDPIQVQTVLIEFSGKKNKLTVESTDKQWNPAKKRIN